uniref:NF-kappa-B inhibitor-like protein 1 n=1 Tax=Leptobrachium leishanense TaxID=445787 RepID=A0A8C5MK02_9ANUR
MSFHRELRALRYIQRGDVLRLKSYIRRHRHLRLDEPLPGGQSLLHAACTIRGEACALLLLRKGADPLKRDAGGNNALHVAAMEAEKGEWTVYTDLVVPILKRCPKALDVLNHQGTTPRDILRRVEELMECNSRITARAGETPNDRSPSKEPMEWRDKLLAACMDEYDETLGYYEDDISDDLPEFETFETWADRIFREYQDKKYPSSAGLPNDRSQQVPGKGAQRNVEEQKYQERRLQKERELRQAQSERYQRRCQEVFGASGDGKPEDPEYPGSSHAEGTCASAMKGETSSNTDPRTGARLLGYSDIPWPVQGGTAVQMAQAIGAITDSSDREAYKRNLRAQRVTWHPDRFLQRCGDRLAAITPPLSLCPLHPIYLHHYKHLQSHQNNTLLQPSQYNPPITLSWYINPAIIISCRYSMVSSTL